MGYIKKEMYVLMPGNQKKNLWFCIKDVNFN